MKPEEVIRELSCMREGARNHGYKGKEYWFKWIAGEGFSVITIALEALEKQIPKKPQLESDGYSDGELVYDTWICPKCGEDYEIDCHDYKYCPECGQRIDRGDIE